MLLKTPSLELQQLKQQEKGERRETTLADDTASNSAIYRARELQQRAAEFGFDWPDITPVFERKQRAMREHRSQLQYRPTDHFMLGINANRAMYLPDGSYGEAFAPLGPAAPEDVALMRD